jgi:hypothetical protein
MIIILDFEMACKCLWAVSAYRLRVEHEVSPEMGEGSRIDGLGGRFLRQAQDRLFGFASRDKTARGCAQDDELA